MSRILLMESLLGHMALLAEKYPKKAASPVTKRCKRAVRQTLQLSPPAATMALAVRQQQTPLRRAA